MHITTIQALAINLIRSDASLASELFNCNSIADAAASLRSIRDELPAALESEKTAAIENATERAEMMNMSEDDKRLMLQLAVLNFPTVEIATQRLNAAARTAFSRWRNGQVKAPLWFDVKLNIAWDTLQVVPFVPRAPGKKAADKAADKAAELDKAADLKAAELLASSDEVGKAADLKAADQIAAADLKVQQAEAKMISAARDGQAWKDKAKKAADTVNAQALEIEELKGKVDRLARANAVLSAALNDESVLNEAAAILAGAVEQTAKRKTGRRAAALTAAAAELEAAA
jgi:hypothetical protein